MSDSDSSENELLKLSVDDDDEESDEGGGEEFAHFEPYALWIRKRFLVKRLLEVAFGVNLVLALFQQWMIPSITNTLIPFSKMDYLRTVERLLKLAVSVPLQMFRVWAFLGMMAQLPLSVISRLAEKRLGSRWGNLIVWSSLVLASCFDREDPDLAIQNKQGFLGKREFADSLAQGFPNCASQRPGAFLEKEQNYTELNIKLNSEKGNNETETTVTDLDETKMTDCTLEETGREYIPSDDSDSSIESVVEACQREPSKRVRRPPVYYYCQNAYHEQNEPSTY
ncbi:Diacylglycerol O-acyltransferase 1 [Eumeta japonica]|uniref:diacylglycerol O-acyltransferase n=1 Tax=Eumeta variegata TaxID=151549 RepID=A0A4C1UN30_EUMVA|nr:Diacylglycerol O-acyltransferase 1 [Eumeta japonica]